jgi:hypothetical protein
MNSQSILKNQVIRYLLENPINDDAPNKYAAVRAEFDIDVKAASRYWIEAKQKYIEFYNKVPTVNLSEREVRKIVTQKGDDLDVIVHTDTEVKTLEQLLKVCEVDSSVWEVVSWQCKKWDLGIKNAANSIETKQLFSVGAKFRPIKVEQNLQLQKEIILKEIFAQAPKPAFPTRDHVASTTRNKLLEIDLFDIHFGKLAHREEVGEDYDLNIAVERFKAAVASLLGRVNLSTVERIMFPVGQDLINVDNLQGTTTGGTPQDTDSRFHKIVKTVKRVLIETIDHLSKIAPVDVVISVGNHDEQTSFMIGEMLEAYYHTSETVNIFNDASLRKYYQFGKVGIMLTHGNKEKWAMLGMIFAAENPKLWAATEFRYIKIGHFHHNKKETTLHTQEFQGFTVQICPSLSGSDAWHRGKGFQSLKQAKASLYDREEGLVGEFTFTVV